MGAKKIKNDWFSQLPAEKQHEYCSRLQGKKKSKYCTIDGKPKGLSLVKSAPAQENPKVLFDADGQGVMNFSYEEESKQLSLTDVQEPEVELTEADKIVQAIAKDNEEKEERLLKEKAHDYYDRESEHVWAKKAEIKNIGEDVEGSARHRKNQHKDWNSEEAFINLDIKINKDILEERNAPDFDSVADEDLPKAFAMRMCLDEYPSTIPHEKGIESREAKLARRKMYIDNYNDLVSKIDAQLRNPEITAVDALKGIRDFMHDRAKAAQGEPHGMLIGESLMKKRNRILGGKNGPYDLLLKSYKPMSDLNPTDFPSVSPWTRPNLNDPKVRDSLKKNKDAQKFYKNLIAKTESLKPEKKIKKNGFEERGIYAGNNSYEIKGSGYKTNSDKQAIDFFKANSRAVQFGNALPDDERKSHLLSCARSLEDLSKLSGLSVKSLTQNGRLAFGFSARGRAGAAAHYDNGRKIINLTRANGFGSLAHELGHALDSAAASKKGSNDKYASEANVYPSYSGVDAVLKKVRQRISKSPEYRNMTPKQRQYWTSTREIFARMFEAHVESKAKKAGVDNTYLVQLPKNASMRSLWPNQDELNEVEQHMDMFLNEYEKTK